VQHRPLVLEDPHPASQQGVVGVLCRAAHDFLVDVGTVDEDPHVHAAPRGGAQRVDEGIRWDEERGRDPQPPARAGDGGVEELLDVGAALGGRASGHLDVDAVVEGGEFGQMGPGQDALGRLGPVLLETAREVAHRRPLDAHVRLAPVVGILGVTRPLLADADAAREADSPVDDQRPPVQAVVDLVERVPVRRAKELHPRARRSPALDERVIDLHRAAERVEQDADLDPGDRALEQRLAEPGDRRAARPVDVAREVDRLLRGLDRCHHRQKDLVAVAQDLDPVSRAHG